MSLSHVSRGRAICMSICALAQSIWLQAIVAPRGTLLVSQADHKAVMALKELRLAKTEPHGRRRLSVGHGAERYRCTRRGSWSMCVGTLPPRSRHHCLGVATDSSGVAPRGRPSLGGGGEQPFCCAALRVQCTALFFLPPPCPKPNRSFGFDGGQPLSEPASPGLLNDALCCSAATRRYSFRAT